MGETWNALFYVCECKGVWLHTFSFTHCVQNAWPLGGSEGWDLTKRLCRLLNITKKAVPDSKLPIGVSNPCDARTGSNNPMTRQGHAVWKMDTCWVSSLIARRDIVGIRVNQGWLTQLIEDNLPADFSSNTPGCCFQVILNTFFVWLGLEVISAGW